VRLSASRGRKRLIGRSVSAQRRCSSVVEQLICNQLVGGSSPFAGSVFGGLEVFGRVEIVSGVKHLIREVARVAKGDGL
jgi:hypothetical protein